MIYLYDDKGTITAAYEDWKRRDVELDIHNGSLAGSMFITGNIKNFKFIDGQYIEKTMLEKYAEKLITQQEYDSFIASSKEAERELIIQKEMRAMAEERAIADGRIE